MKRTTRRAAVGVGLVAALVLVETIVVVSVVSSTSHQELVLQRIDTTRSFYAAEAGMALALRELWVGTDEDGDGIVGGISDDGNDSNDLVIGASRVGVEATPGVSDTLLEAVGRSVSSRRRVDLTVEN